jgi:hypothetical protein
MGTRTIYDFEYMTMGRAVYESILFDIYDAFSIPSVLWAVILPGIGPLLILLYTKVGKTTDKWFSPVSQQGLFLSFVNRFGTNAIVNIGRLWGARLPKPEYVAFHDAWRVAQWIADAVKEYGRCLVQATPSRAVAIAQAAKERGFNISGAIIIVGGEPVTKTKREEIEESGVILYPKFIFSEGGHVGFGCFNPTAPDDMHFLRDSLAVIQHQRGSSTSDTEVGAFLFTSLLPSAPKVLLNVESGDYGTIDQRRCGCRLESLGFEDHILNIRSYDKLTGHGTTVFNSDLIRIIEDVLPHRFGGSSIDYQFIEEEDERGQTRMSLIVNPTVGEVNEGEIITTVLDELGRQGDNIRVMAEIWSQAGTLRVKRMEPVVSMRGKVLHLHLQKKDQRCK